MPSSPFTYTDVTTCGNDLLVRGYDEAGRRYQERVKYRPFLFTIGGEDGTQYKTIRGESVERIDFPTMASARNYVKHNGLMLPIYGMTNFAYPYIWETFGKITKIPEHIRTAFLDIEVGSDSGFPHPETALHPITSVCIGIRGKYYILGCGNYTPHKETITYIKCDTERQLLSRFVRLWSKLDFDIIVGWNSELFDIPYLVNRIARVWGPALVAKLSPWGLVKERMIPALHGGGEKTTYEIVGIASIDYLALYKKFSFIPQESYKLDNVAHVDLGEKKLDYGEYSSLHALYEQNFQRFAEYNFTDVELIEKLDRRHNLIDLMIMLAFDAGVNFSDTIGSIRLWDVLVHNYLLDQNIVIDPIRENSKSEQYAGAYVKEPITGYHEHIVSYDVTSLYPSLIVQYNISPECYVGAIDGFPSVDSLLAKGFPKVNIDRAREDNYALTANGCLWDRRRVGVFPSLVKSKMALRASLKRQMFDAKKKYEETKEPEFFAIANRLKILQHVIKIQINSLYGCLGNPYFRWYRIHSATAITLTGQYCIRRIENEMNARLRSVSGNATKDYVIGVDTDSNYLVLSEFYRDPTTFDEFLTSVVDDQCAKTFQQIYLDTNGVEQAISMKQECIAECGIWTAKKHYVMLVTREEGVTYIPPKLKITGLEAIKTIIQKPIRDKLKEAYHIILTGDEKKLQSFVAGFRQQFFKMSFSDIAFPRGCNNLTGYADHHRVYIKGSPGHTKAALFYNHHLQRLGLDSKYELIKDGDKIKFAYLTTPNFLGAECIAIPANGAMPAEFKVDGFLSYDKMFEKCVIDPLAPLAGARGWSLTPIATLNDFFA